MTNHMKRVLIKSLKITLDNLRTSGAPTASIEKCQAILEDLGCLCDASITCSVCQELDAKQRE